VVEFEARLRARLGAFELDVGFDTEGGRLALVGPNGAGKTSLLKALVGAVDVESGWIRLGERRIVDVEAGLAVPVEERGFGYLPQTYALFPHLSVLRNVEFPMVGRVRGRAARRERAERLLASFGVAHLAERRAAGLSGGEMQRVALARALAVAPKALLLDEPLAAMDVTRRDEVQEFLVEHLTKLALPTLVVTHDIDEAKALGDRIVVLEAGRVTQVGTFEELERAPATSFVARFVQS
jgi:molybdate transport system ATP-binding protein